MKIIQTKFKTLKIVKSLVNKDNRGIFREIFKKKNFKRINFPFICTSTSKKNVLKIDSSILKTHQKHPTGFETIQTYMERDYHIPNSFDNYIYVSQLLQAW